MESGQGGRQTNCREMYIAFFYFVFFRDNIGGGIHTVGEDICPRNPKKRGFWLGAMVEMSYAENQVPGVTSWGP